MTTSKCINTITVIEAINRLVPFMVINNLYFLWIIEEE